MKEDKHVASSLFCLHISIFLLSYFCRYYLLWHKFPLLLHLLFYVWKFGTLWTHLAFPFESQMNIFLKNSHATHGIHKQVSNCLSNYIIYIYMCVYMRHTYGAAYVAILLPKCHTFTKKFQGRKVLWDTV